MQTDNLGRRQQRTVIVGSFETGVGPMYRLYGVYDRATPDLSWGGGLWMVRGSR